MRSILNMDDVFPHVAVCSMTDILEWIEIYDCMSVKILLVGVTEQELHSIKY